MTKTLYTKAREFDMTRIHLTQIQKALLVAGAMLGIAILAVFEIVPEWVGQYAPIALIVLFPGAWMGRDRACSFTRRGKA